MPAESYGFKPAQPEMSFGELMLHIAQANYGYCAFIADTKSLYIEPAKDAISAGRYQRVFWNVDLCPVWDRKFENS